MMGVFKNLTSNVYGRLTVIRQAENTKGRVAWVCLCSCGVEKIVTAQLLRRKTVKSCGCLFKETMHEIHSNKGDGRAYHPLYNSYKNMVSRCSDKRHEQYSDYGGRGIQVCSEWKNDFWKFVSDVGERPSKDYTIDRINNDGNYELSNIRWATWKEQAANRRKRNSHVLDVNCVHTNVGSETTI